MGSRRLDDLSDRFRPLAITFLARTVEASIPILIVETLRTAEEHAVNLRKGVSWTIHSKHLDGDALDICPYQTWILHGANKLQWDPTDPIWLQLGVLGESCGLAWGGRWKQKDLGHFEMPAAPGTVRA